VANVDRLLLKIGVREGGGRREEGGGGRQGAVERGC